MGLLVVSLATVVLGKSLKGTGLYPLLLFEKNKKESAGQDIGGLGLLGYHKCDQSPSYQVETFTPIFERGTAANHALLFTS